MCKQDGAQIWIFLILHVSIPPPVVTRQRCPRDPAVAEWNVPIMSFLLLPSPHPLSEPRVNRACSSNH